MMIRCECGVERKKCLERTKQKLGASEQPELPIRRCDSSKLPWLSPLESLVRLSYSNDVRRQLGYARTPTLFRPGSLISGVLMNPLPLRILNGQFGRPELQPSDSTTNFVQPSGGFFFSLLWKPSSQSLEALQMAWILLTSACSCSRST